MLMYGLLVIHQSPKPAALSLRAVFTKVDVTF